MNFDYKRLVKYEHNIGEKEAKWRMMGGIALILISLFTAKILLLLVGMVLIGTSYSGWCPAYSALDKNSLENPSPENSAGE